ncbi:MAG: N-acetylmuramoyl-L-alanine amidase [bacterium]|nr:N-acetylmuramoyl-L-alanine amidase [bacterium]
MKDKDIYFYVIFIFSFLFITSLVYGGETIYTLPYSPIEGISWEQTEDGDIFRILTSSKLEFSYSYLQNPYRFFVDIFPVNININKVEIPVGISGIEKIRLAKQSDDKIRIVFDLSGPIRYREIKQEENCIIIIFPPRLKELSLQIDLDKLFLKIVSSHRKELNPEIFYLVNPDRIVIDIPNMTLMYDNYINPSIPIDLKVSQFSIYPPSIRIVVKGGIKNEWQMGEMQEPGTVLLQIPILQFEKVAKPIIILDPGHGGNDPGAIGPSGLKEKDVTLDVVLYMKGLLESAGYRVILTRDGDYNVSQSPQNSKDELNARVVIVNNHNSAVLVSVHCNSAYSPIPGGIEVFYYRDDDKAFAETVCNSLVEITGRYNRGTKRAEFFLLKNTNIPAILVEALFISNPIEEKLLMDPLYRRKIAGGIVTGILRYLEKK